MKLLHYRSATLHRYVPLRCKPPSFLRRHKDHCDTGHGARSETRTHTPSAGTGSLVRRVFPFRHSCILVRLEGIEPTTFGLRVRCSTG